MVRHRVVSVDCDSVIDVLNACQEVKRIFIPRNIEKDFVKDDIGKED